MTDYTDCVQLTAFARRKPGLHLAKYIDWYDRAAHGTRRKSCVACALRTLSLNYNGIGAVSAGP